MSINIRASYDSFRDLRENDSYYIDKTGVNNIVLFSILSPNFASAIGFTDENVRKILEDAGIMDRYEEVAEWYDG